MAGQSGFFDLSHLYEGASAACDSLGFVDKGYPLQG
jgi:hypothetical protein